MGVKGWNMKGIECGKKDPPKSNNKKLSEKWLGNLIEWLVFWWWIGIDLGIGTENEHLGYTEMVLTSETIMNGRRGKKCIKLFCKTL